MISHAVTTRYANALIDVLLGPNAGMQSADAVTQLRSFKRPHWQPPRCAPFSLRPRLLARLASVLLFAASPEAQGLSRIITNFLLVLSDHGRAGALTETIQTLEQLLDERMGFVHADVRSAFELYTRTTRGALPRTCTARRKTSPHKVRHRRRPDRWRNCASWLQTLRRVRPGESRKDAGHSRSAGLREKAQAKRQ